MAALRISLAPSQTRLLPSPSTFPSKHIISSISSLPFRHLHVQRRSPKLHIACSSPAENNSTTATIQKQNPSQTSETFDWYSQWYPLDPVCDLDKTAPKAQTLLGLDVVIWWDRAAGTWKVFEDRCPHRLAPLSEGRIDDRGRLQCVYHGWCFDGAGACKYIPQAPALGPPVHENKKACVAVYPSIVQNNILWFWPNTSSQYRDILQKSKPLYIPELDDPSYFHVMMSRDLFYGYEILTENLLDPAHLPYSHYGMEKFMTIVLCVPVNPGKSRAITLVVWNYANWIDKILPAWHYHKITNLILDSDLCLLHKQEQKLFSDGSSNWHNLCYVPTQSDTFVVAFRSWLQKYSNNKVNWRDKDSASLPTPPPREQLMDRYYSHTIHCKSCSRAVRALKALEIFLQVLPIGLIGILAAANRAMVANTTKITVVSIAILSFVASHQISQYTRKMFYYHDYNHAIYRTDLLKKILATIGAVSVTL